MYIGLLLLGMLATFLYLFKVIFNIFCCCFIDKSGDNISKNEKSNNMITKEEQELIREKRLKKLKIQQILKSQNIERDLAQKLGMQFGNNNINNKHMDLKNNENNNIDNDIDNDIENDINDDDDDDDNNVYNINNNINDDDPDENIDIQDSKIEENTNINLNEFN